MGESLMAVFQVVQAAAQLDRLKMRSGRLLLQT
jgi:hypothetical protein